MKGRKLLNFGRDQSSREGRSKPFRNRLLKMTELPMIENRDLAVRDIHGAVVVDQHITVRLRVRRPAHRRSRTAARPRRGSPGRILSSRLRPDRRSPRELAADQTRRTPSGPSDRLKLTTDKTPHGSRAIASDTDQQARRASVVAPTGNYEMGPLSQLKMVSSELRQFISIIDRRWAMSERQCAPE
jgi:hypothetical protein